MIVWLASYPKSGNTYLRSILASYFFSKDGNYTFDLIKNINQFPHGGLFKKLGIDINNQEEVVRNYIKVQEIINKKNSIQFFKTHSFFFKQFTDLKNTLGVIYIVRDPRNVVTSLSNFLNIPVDKALKYMTLGKGDGLTWMESWSKNYNSWKLFKNYEKYLLIKYEDLITKPDVIFLEILKFLFRLQNNSKLKIDENKFKNALDSTSFENLKKLENEKGFSEAKIDPDTGKQIPFFKLGSKRDWKKILEEKFKVEIEKNFKEEMQELGYL
ncbi:sulfotransferase domain-containing protein [Candidatus Pelagibacter bacterium]|nr:sulfotransferase domain-containing protein [Candidatus Pelagibacter bacterium]